MIRKLYFAAFMLASVMPLAAQETYEIAEVGTQDLNGTARYVGMGGAMEALGEENTLSGPALSYETGDLAGTDDGAEVVQDDFPVEFFGDVLDGDQIDRC